MTIRAVLWSGATSLVLALSVGWPIGTAHALSHIWHQVLPGVHSDQSDIVRLPNVSAQVSYYAIVREAGPALLLPMRHVPSHTHPAERDEMAERYRNMSSWVPMEVLPTGDIPAAVALTLGGWIGGGHLRPEGRIDAFSSFMPQSVPAKLRFEFEREVPPAFARHATGPREAVLQYDAAKVHERSRVYLPFPLGASATPQDARLTVVLNGHDLKPIRVRFTGQALRLPETRLDGPGRLFRYQEFYGR